MSRSLEPTLLSLLPTFPSSSSLPRELLELASSLLAQSRHNASTLKAEEEVSRLYACAHIACERLKISLDLPPIQPRPPVPPRIYKRLYNHLDRVLIAPSAKVRTPISKARDGGAGGLFGSASTQRVKERKTPSKDVSLAQFRSPEKGDVTPTKSTSTAKKRKAPTASDNPLPTWIRPTIKSICTQLDSDRIGRTVLAGMQTIVAPSNQRTKDDWVNAHLTSLLAAVYFLVVTKVVILETGKEFDSKQYTKLRRKILAALEQAHSEVDDYSWDGWSDIGTKDVDGAVNKVVESTWQDEEWFTGIQDMVHSQNPTNRDGADVDGTNEGQDCAAGERALTQRGDTMFQSRWVMTDRKREEYRLWKEDIMKRIEDMENAKSGEMDADVVA
ncbi:origin recognition complex, subunit 6 [Pseudomassariella vexata]|uniref:Origin recognition complex, subunit 6 n=1 Tax=Pseudomassariella vexata TaxID=1141098 RepID=A0A1Y2DLI6_9PEZI|nr:origin recognition complex, subunit 6 [Pseudomassariella vexata]ORY59976.1 origin recognition complex, subunit 6 [Pseudomassariella vexata]